MTAKALEQTAHRADTRTASTHSLLFPALLHSFFSKYLLSTYSVPGTRLGTGDATTSRDRQGPRCDHTWLLEDSPVHPGQRVQGQSPASSTVPEDTDKGDSLTGKFSLKDLGSTIKSWSLVLLTAWTLTELLPLWKTKRLAHSSQN